MIFSDILDNARQRLDKRRRYHRLVDEIESMSVRDLTDLRADRGDMLRAAYRQIYG